MEQKKIQKAAQLADDMKKVKRAIDLIGAAEKGNVNVRLSSGSAESSDDISFAERTSLGEVPAESGRTRRTGKAVVEEFRQCTSGKTTV